MAVGSHAGRIRVHPAEHLGLASRVHDNHWVDLHAAVVGRVRTDA